MYIQEKTIMDHITWNRSNDDGKLLLGYIQKITGRELLKKQYLGRLGQLFMELLNIES